MFYGGAVFPGPGAEFSFDEDAVAFAEIFFGIFGLGVEEDHAVPFGDFDGVAAGGVGKCFGGGEREGGDGSRAVIANLGVAAEVADEYYLLV